MLSEDEIISILFDWNYWNKGVENIFLRKGYLNLIKNYRSSGEIISLIGIRRSGKSTLLKQEIKNLLELGIDKKQIIFLNLEDPRFSNFLNTSLLDKIFEVYKRKINSDKLIYLFLDEVQNIHGWEKWVRMMYDLNKAKLYVTGSSSKLLSKELGTVLTGRNLKVDVFPLSFEEFLEFKSFKINSNLDLISKKNRLISFFNEYLEKGGLPKVVQVIDNLKTDELFNYFQNILMRDVVARYSINNYNNLEKLATYLVSNSSKLYSLNNLKKMLNISYESISNYISYLKEALLFYELSKFDYSLKEQNSAIKKIYTIDTGLANAISFKFSENKGRLLENLVFIELKRRGKEIYYHRAKKECDFLIKQGLDIVDAIQVCYNLDEDNKKREFSGLIEACKTYNLKEGLLLTYDYEDELILEDVKIVIKPVWKWLLSSAEDKR